jgi:hypothetical protein
MMGSCAWIVAEIIAIGIVELILYVPMFFRLLFRKFSFVHSDITSDIPGNPHCFNLLVISMFQTLPEPNNFNLVWTRVPISEDILVKGRIPPSRVSSLSVYGEGSDNVPRTIELYPNVDARNRLFEVIITKNPSAYAGQANKLIINCEKGWTHAMVVMRNYLVPPGYECYTPEISLVNDPSSVIRCHQQLVSGAPNLHLNKSDTCHRIMNFVTFNCFIWLINGIFSNCLFSKDSINNMFQNNILISMAGLIVCYLFHSFLYCLAKKRLKTFVKQFIHVNEENKLVLTVLTESSKVSQPSKLHKYWIMKYNLATNSRGNKGNKEGSDDQEVSIQGKINTKYQKYWSCVIYDEYGIPLPQFVYDETVHRIPLSSTKDEEVYTYDIRLKKHGLVSSSLTDNTTSIDCSKSLKGYVLFRLVHPLDDAAVQFSSPTSSVISSSSSEKSKML